VRAGGSPGGRSQLVEQALLGDDIEAVAEADRRMAGDQGGEAVAALLHSGIALVEALDGTTNALGLSAAEVFAPLYGPDSASRFRALPVETVAVAVPNLAEDVDTLADLERLQLRCGPRTQAALAALSAGTAQ